MATNKRQSAQAEKNRRYWQRREDEALQNYLEDEEEYSRRVNRIYTDMYDRCIADIEAFYGRYASKEGITLAEARRRVSQADIRAYERLAQRYVQDAARDRRVNGGRTNRNGYYFSERANEEMRLYNLTMKVNRLEMLKANLGLEMVKGHAELETFMEEILQGRTMAELERQAGILGKTVRGNVKDQADSIVRGSFHNATFSDRIWQYHDLMKADLSKLLERALIQGKNPRAVAGELQKYLLGEKTGGGARYNMERLMRTELARVQTEVQKKSFVRNGFDKYQFVVNHDCCPICEAVANHKGRYSETGVFLVKDMMAGKNAPPMHPNCRCSTAAWEDDEEYDAWLNFLASGGTTAEWNRRK